MSTPRVCLTCSTTNRGEVWNRISFLRKHHHLNYLYEQPSRALLPCLRRCSTTLQMESLLDAIWVRIPLARLPLPFHWLFSALLLPTLLALEPLRSLPLSTARKITRQPITSLPLLLSCSLPLVLSAAFSSTFLRQTF